MGVQNPNSTSYVHPNEPNLLDIHKAMEYRDGVPHLRVNLGSDNITISGDVNIADQITVNNTTSNPVPVTIQNASVNVVQDTIPWQISGNAYANSNSNPIYTQFLNNTLAVTGDFYPATQLVSGTVELGNTTLTALETVNANVSGTVTIQDGGGSITVDGTVSATVSGTVSIDSLPEVEIKNDSGHPIPISKDTNANSTTNRLYVSMETDAVVADSNYFFNVARGLVDSQYLEFKNGYCGSMSSSTTGYTVWNEGTAYPWSSWTTAQTLYIASSSASDNNTKQVLIKGLDASFNKVSEYVTLNGTNAVTTVNQYLRVNNTILVQGVDNVGNIHTRIGSAAGTIVGSMAPGMGRNKQGVFTVPAGYTAYILYGDVSSYKNGTGNVSGQVDMRVRTNVTGTTTPFLNASSGIAANGQFRSDFPVPFQVPAKTDIDVRFAASGNQTTVTCSWEMILIPD